MQHIYEFQKMGANISLDGNTASVIGSKSLTAASITGGDLRSCAAMVLASLAADGTSIIKGLDHLDRGYENLALKLKKIGACISRSQSKAQEISNPNTKTLEAKQNIYSETDVA